MANFTAADIKTLREQTGAGMLDVKKALDEADGDHGKAAEILRVKGLKGVTKREGRTTSNGLVAAKAENGVGTLVEVLCETDFVAKSEKFIALAEQVLDQSNAVIGEKIEVKRVARVEGERVAAYLHKTSPDLPAQIGVLVAIAGGDDQVARDIAMHAAALPPTALTRDDIPAETVENERRVAEATAREEGKPEAALSRIVEGRVNGFFKDNVLIEQSFARDQKKTVGQVLKDAKAEAQAFARFRVGS